MLSQPSPVSGLQKVQMLHCTQVIHTPIRGARAAGRKVASACHEELHGGIRERETGRECDTISCGASRHRR